MKKFLVGILALGMQSLCLGDVYQEAASVAGIVIKTWTTDTKQRSEVPIPMIGGKSVTITRVDKGVQWMVDDGARMYQEKPIAIPYDATGISGEEKSLDDRSLDVQINKLPEGKKVGGFQAEGYEMKVENQKMIMWVTQPTGELEKAMKEMEVYSKAYQKKAYEKFPEKERTSLADVMSAAGGMMKSLGGNMAQMMKKMPKGFLVGMEGEMMPGMGGSAMIYEIRKIAVTPAAASLFEIPAGYQKVDDLQKAMGAGMMQRMMEQMGNMSDEEKQKMLEGMKGMGGQQQPHSGGGGMEGMEELMKKLPAGLNGQE